MPHVVVSAENCWSSMTFDRPKSASNRSESSSLERYRRFSGLMSGGEVACALAGGSAFGFLAARSGAERDMRAACPARRSC